jgi:putative transcriptional regulator
MALCIPGLFAGNGIFVPGSLRDLGGWSRTVQYSAQDRPSIGAVLVANQKLADPNFAQSVILIVQFDKDGGTVGLIINRQTEIPVSRIFPKVKQATKDPVYLGGPLEVTSGQALLRLPEKTTQATHVAGDIYVTGSKDLIEKSVASQADPSKFRLYLGYAGWAPGQLEAEIRLGAWSFVSGGPDLIFDREPDSLWSRLIHREIASDYGPKEVLSALSAPCHSRFELALRKSGCEIRQFRQ